MPGEGEPTLDRKSIFPKEKLCYVFQVSSCSGNSWEMIGERGKLESLGEIWLIGYLGNVKNIAHWVSVSIKCHTSELYIDTRESFINIEHLLLRVLVKYEI